MMWLRMVLSRTLLLTTHNKAKGSSSNFDIMVCNSDACDYNLGVIPLVSEEKECTSSFSSVIPGGRQAPPSLALLIRHQKTKLAGVLIFTLMMLAAVGALPGSMALMHDDQLPGDQSNSQSHADVTRIVISSDKADNTSSGGETSNVTVETPAIKLAEDGANSKRRKLQTSPTKKPVTRKPTRAPISKSPTRNPTRVPTRKPTSYPTTKNPVSSSPTHYPTTSPSNIPTSSSPSHNPTMVPSHNPTRFPTTNDPTSSSPSTSPTTSPSDIPTSSSTSSPTITPTNYPTIYPTTNNPTSHSSTNNPTPIAFVRGDLAITVESLGIKMCTGMSVKVLARAGQKVPLAGGGTSSINFHSQPDGAGIVPLSTGGYVYVTNSELSSAAGGVYGLYFDSSGNVSSFTKFLGSTTRNCGGGLTPWNTWITCEEFGTGQCWQIDPNPNQLRALVTPLGGTGGNFESVAVDNRNPLQPIFFVTEDAQYGALRKYTPLASSTTANFETVHAAGGTYEYLVILNSTHFKWSTDLQEGRNSQAASFAYCEGIDFHNGYLYFVSKTLYKMFVLDLDNGTYTSSSTKYGTLGTGGGNFNDQPDQIVRNGGDYLYLTEDGGSTPGVYSIHKPTGAKYAIFQGYSTALVNDETTGLAFSPDGRKMYAAFQDCGCLLEFTRDDGLSFDGEKLDLKFHTPTQIF